MPSLAMKIYVYAIPFQQHVQCDALWGAHSHYMLSLLHIFQFFLNGLPMHSCRLVFLVYVNMEIFCLQAVSMCNAKHGE